MVLAGLIWFVSGPGLKPGRKGKGGYSFRRKKELGLEGEIWPPGFSDVRVRDRKSFLAHKKYIDENPVKAGLAKSAEEYPYCSAYFRKKKKASG
jgi:hypothetical protein